MRSLLTSAILIGALLAPAAGMAAAATTKLGYVAMTRALNEVEDGKAAKNKLKNEFEGRQKKLDEMQQGLKNDKDEFDKRIAMMKPEAKAQKQEELQRKFLELQQTYMQLQKELVDQETKLTQDITAKMRNVIARIGDRDGYMMILDIGETVLYYKRHMDLTDQVVKEYNAQFGKK
ncbi:MAG: OmpH family outer membrane protein [Myxococcota bacterium]